MANVGPSSACQFSGRTQSSRSQQHGRCRATTLAVPHGLGIQFNLPYRVSFGQSLSIVGSSEVLGNWDVERRVPMQWSDGDIWQAEVQASHDLEALEYKYIVVEHDGHISCWKPGENVRLTLPRVKASTIEVRDAWDGSVHEVLPQLSLDVEPDPTPVASTAYRTERSPSQANSVLGEDVDMAVENALQRTYSELENTLRLSLQLVDDAADPSDPRLLMNDQKLAAVTRRAISLSQALEAGAPPPAYILKSIEDDKLRE